MTNLWRVAVLVVTLALTLAFGSLALNAGTVGHSNLAIPCGGLNAPADWYFPTTPPTGLVWLQHGNLSSKSDVAAFAQDFSNRTRSIVVAPTLSTKTTDPCWEGGSSIRTAIASMFTGSRAALNASAHAAGYAPTLPQPFVLMGHSLGGSLALSVAANANPDLRAVILLDAGDGDASYPLAALPAITVPIMTVSSPPNTACKVGDITPLLVAARPGQFVGVQLVNGKHLDAIGWSNLGGIILCGLPNLENVAAVQTLASQWAMNALTGSNTGITSGTPGQHIPVGAATAVVLPA